MAVLLALMTTACSGMGMGGGNAVPDRLDRLEARLDALEQTVIAHQQEWQNRKPALDRLTRIEGDINILVEQLAALAAMEDAGLPPKKRSADKTKDSGSAAGGSSAGGLDRGLHVASYQSKSNLATGWAMVQEIPRIQNGPYTARVEELTLGTGKTFYRLIIGPLQAEDDQDALCALIEDKTGFCEYTPFLGQPLSDVTGS
ncbi:hypothetical protein [Yunchengibacter salinarum]|uniref:hypothetical protein n=1 Tax=Yunchengibacter salinarum TaxID=3133399 RepID=UPI0035B5E9BB